MSLLISLVLWYAGGGVVRATVVVNWVPREDLTLQQTGLSASHQTQRPLEEAAFAVTREPSANTWVPAFCAISAC